MYLRHLRVQNLKLVRELDLPFVNPDGSPRMWTVLVGENGLCKTALLQAVALAAAGHERGNQLASAQLTSARALTDRRKPDSTTVIEAEFGFSQTRHQVRRYPGILRDFQMMMITPPRLWSRIVIPPRTTVLTATSGYELAPQGVEQGSVFLARLDVGKSLLRLRDVQLRRAEGQPLPAGR